MRSFLIKTILFFLILVAIDRPLVYLLRGNRPSDYKSFLDSKQAFFNKNQNVDLLIIGDSHIADALDTRILESTLSLNSYNLGIYHATPYENYFVTRAALEHLKQSPKVVVLGTNPEMFAKTVGKGKYTPLIVKDLYNNYYLSANSGELDESFIIQSVQEKDLYSHVYKKILGKKYKPSREVKSVHNGFLEFYNQKPNIDWSSTKDEEDIPDTVNHKQLEYFVKTIDLLKENNIDIIIVNPPIWHTKFTALTKRKTFSAFEKELASVGSKYNIPIFNPKNELLAEELKQEDFLNLDHLNYNGAKKFTHCFSNYFLTQRIQKTEQQISLSR